MPDSFTLANQPTPPATPQSQAAPAAPNQPASSAETMKLSDVVYQQQDAIVFDGSRIPSVQSSSEAFIIFYLTLQDEENGYGTVIQLDPATKQAAIFADLNPEYTYLFYKDEQGQLQTLLWCIEFATRTNDGLYVTQAKVHGKGVTEADMRHLSQIKAPNAESGQQHPLPEQDTVMSAQPPQAAPMTQPLATENVANTPAPMTGSADAAPTNPPALNPPATAPEAAAPEIIQSPPTFPTPASPDIAVGFGPDVPAAATEPSLNLPPLPGSAPSSPPATTVQSTSQPPQSPAAPSVDSAMAPQPTASDPGLDVPLPPLPEINAVAPVKPAEPMPQPKPDWHQPRPTVPTPTSPQLTDQDWNADPLPLKPEADPLPLPPLPDLPPMPPQIANSANDNLLPKADASVPEAFTPVASSAAASQPNQPNALNQSSTAPNPEPSGAASSKNPVGRPPKPLTADAAWMIEPQDFNWLKTISRDPWSNHQDEIRQKLIKQIRKNKPNLIDDWQFHGVLEQAFQAVGQTYELVPSLRHDLLKALMNGKVVDQVLKQMRDQ